MSGQYTVSATSAAQEPGAVTQTLASLPATFGPAPENQPGTAHVLVVAGGPGWAAEALSAVAAGARGIVVAHPVPEDTTELAAAADAAGTAVVLDHRWASSPALAGESTDPDARDAVRSAAGTASLLDSVATAAPGSDPQRLLSEHLAALLAVTGPLDGVRVLRSDTTGYTVSGRLANGAPFTAQGVLTAARPAGVDIRLYTTDGGVAVQVPDPDAAWPAEVRITGSHAELLLPTLYESAHRSTWRRLKDHLRAGTRPDDLAGFARLTDLYATLAAT
jgi:threonine dehydrogenase-like Zn-dependent dehydrogenase